MMERLCYIRTRHERPVVTFHRVDRFAEDDGCTARRTVCASRLCVSWPSVCACVHAVVSIIGDVIEWTTMNLVNRVNDR